MANKNGWVKTQIAIPVDILKSSNYLASLFDPDTGGDKTFGNIEASFNGEYPVTHYIANTHIKQIYLTLIRNPHDMLYALSELSREYGRTPPTKEQVDSFCSKVIIGECGLKIIGE